LSGSQHKVIDGVGSVSSKRNHGESELYARNSQATTVPVTKTRENASFQAAHPKFPKAIGRNA